MDSSLSGKEKLNAVFLCIYILQQSVNAVISLINEGLFVMILLSYPHWLLIFLNFLILLPSLSRESRLSLCRLTWVHYLCLLLVIVVTVYQLCISYDFLSHSFKPSSFTGFWRLMRKNFLIVCMITPGMLCFVMMRFVAEEYVERRLQVGAGEIEF